MKAYFIDPKAQTVEAIEYDGSYEAIRQLVTGGEGYVDVSNVDGGNSLIVHDEGLIRLAESDLSGLDTMPLGWLLMQDEQPVSLLVGPALWVGYDADGMECDPSVPLELVRQHVRFLCRDVHEVGATIHAARRILSSCGIAENREHQERIVSGNQHTLTNLLFADKLATLKAKNEMLREALKDADNELDWLDEDMDTCDHSVGVCMCDYWNMRRKMKAALAREASND